MRPSSHPKDAPNVERCSQREHEARKQDCRSAPLELAVLPIVEIRHTQLRKEEHGEDKINRGEHDLVDYLFDLPGSVVPGTFIAPATSPAAKAGVAMRTQTMRTRQSMVISLFFFINFQSFRYKMAAEDSQRPCVCLRGCRGNMPFLPQGAPDRDAVREIHAEHPRGRPAVE